MPIKKEVKQTRDMLAGKTKPKEKEVGLSTGLALFNLALSGKTKTGLKTGKYYLFVGDSAAGKTALALQCLAEANLNPAFKDYEFNYCDPEHSIQGLETKFGSKLQGRINWLHPVTLEEMYWMAYEKLKAGTKMVWVVDSNDALVPEADLKFRAARQKAKKDGESKGSYGTAKAKENKGGVSSLLSGLDRTGSIFINISQTISNVGNPFQEKGRAGGGSLKFFNSGEAWFSIRKAIKRTVNKKERKIGSLLRIQVKKNRSTGREPTIDIPFYPSHGFDDTGSCVRFLVDEGRIQKEGKKEEETRGGKVDDNPKITCDDFGYHGRLEGLVQKIEEGGMESKLRLIVAEVWDQIEEESRVVRKKRYV